MSSITRRDKGFSLVELILAASLFSVLLVTVFGVYRIIFISTTSVQDRMQLQRTAEHGLEKAIRDLRTAVALQNDPNNAIRYTLQQGAVQNSFILYLYNAADPFPPPYTQLTYELRQAPVVGAIGGAFVYGGGTLLVRDVQPPPASAVGSAGSLATLDLSVTRGTETYRLVKQVRRRS